MIRVGIKGKNYILVIKTDKLPTAIGVELTPQEIGDLYAQIKSLVPPELTTLKPFCTDPPTPPSTPDDGVA